MTNLESITAANYLPPCDHCGDSTRLVGIEPHPRLAHMHLHTFFCDRCDLNAVIVMPLPASDRGGQKENRDDEKKRRRSFLS